MDVPYAELPGPIKDNIAPDQWAEAQRDIIAEGDPVPETTQYINLKNGQILPYQQGQRAAGPLLPTHDLSGGHGTDDTQFNTTPKGARGKP